MFEDYFDLEDEISRNPGRFIPDEDNDWWEEDQDDDLEFTGPELNLDDRREAWYESGRTPPRPLY